ncbi:response regulator transcription factor [Sinomonas sp. ASV486]|uniref:response regulator transcription factor n=1 Tax=Sinomonas sp. ASV486 TaxID=3051170 RepID=UPI0027DE08C7|nr:response regulator transcription factor [Sinomonas sp. ASV486]MDQ4489446.1 response regulator transcription factor [Sinomonas sp. ASV486]
MPGRILLVEDDDGIALPLVRTLEREEYDVERVADGAAALGRLLAGNRDLVILDLGLPDMDGLDVCRRAREQGFAGGIIVLTARSGELDRVVGLDVGADDYMAKPFGLAELLARIRAILRRSAPSDPVEPAVRLGPGAAAAEGGLEVDVASRRVHVGATEIPLSAKEFDLLVVLHEHRGAVVTRERLIDQVWDENWFGSTKTLDVRVARLRQKLDAAAARARVTTIRGVGFRLDEQADDA